MNKDELLNSSLAENILTLLVFDDEFCPIVRNTISANLFESQVFRDIASRAIDYYDQFKVAVKEHLPDELDSIINGTDKRKATSYRRVLDNMLQAKDGMNREYVISKLNAFVRQQAIKGAIVRAVEAVEDGNIDQAEIELHKGLDAQMISFEIGTAFADPKQSLQFFDHVNDGIQTGIAQLDKRDVCPRRQEMYLFMAPAKKGKSWALIQIGKWALLQRQKVLHITLEMSEQRVSQRYIQSFFSVSKREAQVKSSKFKVDKYGYFTGITTEELTRPTLRDEGIRKQLASRLTREFRKRPPLIIKQFPTGQLTVPMYNAYLDGLERFHKFIPDVVVFDYPDLMKIDAERLRVDTGRVFRDLRGVAVERNHALVCATQGNRESAKARIMTDSMVAEDYSKIATADTCITYSQTSQEKKLGLARLFVTNSRNDEDKFVVLISQQYAIGQFCLDSAMMSVDYDDVVDRLGDESHGRRRKVDEDSE